MESVKKELKISNFEIDVNDIYISTAEISKFIFDLGDVKEIENSYATDGPEKTTNAVFVLKKPFDKNSSAETEFFIKGKSNSRENKIHIKIITSIEIEFNKKNNLIYETYMFFYLSHIMPKIENITEDGIYDLEKKMKDFIINRKQVAWESV